jgi:hypothetical protein
MRRVHLFEFHDLSWFPHTWRKMLTDVLSFFTLTFRPFSQAVPKLKDALERLDCRTVVDLCSGSSGPLLQIQKQLEEKEAYPVRVILTDRFPNMDAFRRAALLSNGKISFVQTPVDATNVPASLNGFRTLFVAFHHFRPPLAKQILQDAVSKKEGIGVFEYTERSLDWVVPSLLTPLLVWIITPFLRPLTFSRVLWTYVLPVIPLVVFWDGIVSNFRTYSVEELKQLTLDIQDNGYSWEIGKIPSGQCQMTYLLGYPMKPSCGKDR